MRRIERAHAPQAFKLAPDGEYPGGTPESKGAVSDEAGPQWKPDCQDDLEIVGVLKPVQEGSRGSSAGEGGLRRTANGTDGGVTEATEGGRLRGMEAWAAKETAIVEEALEKGDAERPATFWEECGPSRYRLQPEWDMRRRDT
ncbi:hypothetical protein NDU88_002866 [Pleurodeles waltl]|uniref:Uncharacterized protein n=1 Tax=Pleurodeles waltl TaxID=8319 RepID=A0AAV7MRS9_PLEWA|nr:hypothetical protein NDU88_002866 [Pleurodeles waltl]